MLMKHSFCGRQREGLGFKLDLVWESSVGTLMASITFLSSHRKLGKDNSKSNELFLFMHQREDQKIEIDITYAMYLILELTDFPLVKRREISWCYLSYYPTLSVTVLDALDYPPVKKKPYFLTFSLIFPDHIFLIYYFCHF